MGDDGPRTAADLVRGRAGDHGTGLWFEGRAWTWAEVVEQAAARASLLRAARVDGPFHVGVLLENTPEYLFTLAGAALAGAVVVGLNPTRRGEELAADVRATDCQLVLTDATGAPLLEGLDLGIDADRVWVTDGPAHSERVAGAAGSALPEDRPAPEDLYLLIFTSGSTGRPKAVRMTQGRAARAAARIPFSPDDVLYSAMPLFHGNALAAAVFPAFATGATIALRRRFSASGFLPDIRTTGATFFNTVGRAISHILATPPTDHDRDHQLKFVLGPETSAPDKAAFTERFGPPVFEGYGSSENAIVLQPATRARPGALGRAAEGDDIVVIDPATDQECPRATFDGSGRLTNAAEAIGELVGRNVRSAFEGYYNNPEAEAERTRNGWYWSGDLAYRDDDGTFYFAGRTGDWLRVDSENFAAAPIERILTRWEPLRGVAVYPVPDPASGDQVMVAVEMVDGVDLDPDGLRDFLAAQPDLGTKWAPRYVRVVAALPATGTDKVDKQPLRRQKWDTTDPLWHRVGRSDDFVPMTADDVAELRAAFEATGRADLL